MCVLLSFTALGTLLVLVDAGYLMFLVLGVLLSSPVSFALVAYPRDDDLIRGNDKAASIGPKAKGPTAGAATTPSTATPATTTLRARPGPIC